MSGYRGKNLVALLILSISGWWISLQLLNPLTNFATHRLFGLSANSAASAITTALLYDVPRLLLILAMVIFCVGIVRSYLAPERVRHALAGKNPLAGCILASLLGTVMPFCTCSAVPLFIGFVEAGVPLGVTFSFLVAAPMINEIAIVMLWNMFDPQIVALYIGTGLIISVTAGLVIGRLNLAGFIEKWVYDVRISDSQQYTAVTWEDRIRFGCDAMCDTIRRIWPYVIFGMLAGVLINRFATGEQLSEIMGDTHWWSVPLAVMIGVPTYSSAAGVIPVVQALLEKGAAVGTVLAFMMSVIGLSLPEMIILRKVLRWPLLLLFIGIVTAGITTVGFLLNSFF